MGRFFRTISHAPDGELICMQFWQKTYYYFYIPNIHWRDKAVQKKSEMTDCVKDLMLF